jgi:RHS repeat-associated protein
MPPPWRGQPLTTHQEWTFSGPPPNYPQTARLDTELQPPDTSTNPYPVFGPYGSGTEFSARGLNPPIMEWLDNIFGAQGVWRVAPVKDKEIDYFWGWLEFGITNAGLPGHAKEVRVQITYKDVTGPPDVFFAKAQPGGGAEYWQHVPWLVAQAHPDPMPGWKHRTYRFHLFDCPAYDSLSIYPPGFDGEGKGGVVYVDHVVVDTICRPVEPQDGGGVHPPAGEQRLGLHLAPGADVLELVEQYGLGDVRRIPVPQGGTLLSARAAAGAREALARDARVQAVEADPCRDMLQGGGVSLAEGDKKDCDETQTVLGGTKVQGSGQSNDPVDTYTGELFFHEAPDLDLGGPLPVIFQRYYASALDGPLSATGMARAGAARMMIAGPSATPETFLAGAAPAWDGRPLAVGAAGADGRVASLLVPAGPPGRLGVNWRHTFDWTLQRVGAHVLVLSPEGRGFRFWRDRGGWRQAGAFDTPVQLLETPAGFTFAARAGGVRHVFDRAGRLARVEDGRGHALALGYRDGRLLEVADGLGRRLILAYDADGRLIEVADGTRTVRFGHAGALLSRVTDAAGAVTGYRYDDRHARRGLLVGVVRPNGNTPYTQTYDADGRVATQTDAGGHTTRFAYVAGTTTITDPAGRAVRHAHDAAGRLIGVTDEAGQRFTLSYDPAGRRSGLTDRLGDTTRAAYHERSGALRSTTEADGATTRFAYALRHAGGVEAHNLVQVVHPDGATEQLAHDAAGNVTAWTDAAGNSWRYAHDARGRLVAATAPDGAVTRYAYHPDGTLASRTEPAGHVTSYEYDARRRLARIRLADGASRGYAYDARDRPVAWTDERGQTWRYGYDANGNPTTLTDPLGAVTRVAYDAMDRPVELTDPGGRRTRLAFTERSRVKTWTGPGGGTVGLEYDPRGRVAAIVGPEGQRWVRGYDAEGVMTTGTDPLGGTRRFESDRLGRYTRLTGRDGHPIELAYDRLGRLVAARDALGHTTSRTFDASGRLTGTSVGDGTLAARYAWDAAGRLTEVTDPEGHRWQRTHDRAGRLSGARDPLGRTVAFTRDARGRIATITLPGGLGSVGLGYDAAGQLVGRRHPDGSELRYEYDAAGRLTRADGLALRYDGAGRLAESNGLALAHDAGGRLARVVLAPGKAVEYAYDRAGRLAEVRDWLGGRTTFAYDAAGRLVRLARPNGATAGFAHDPEGRLVGIQEGGLARIVLTRDARGRVARAERALPLAASATAGQQRLAFDAASQVAGFDYDGLGRLVKDDRRAYVWDAASRLAGYSEGGRTVTATYDGLGQRLSRRDDGATREYVWHYGLALPSVAVEREAGTDRAYYVHAPDGALLYRVDARDGSRRFYHFDEMGNTLFLTDDRGTVTAAYAYTPYGVPVAARGDPDNPFTWGGQWGAMREGATGLYYLRARWYDSATGRFVSPDPLPSLGPRTVNPYQYAAANPLRYADPRGLQAEPPPPPEGPPPTEGEDRRRFFKTDGQRWSLPFAQPSPDCGLTRREAPAQKMPAGTRVQVSAGPDGRLSVTVVGGPNPSPFQTMHPGGWGACYACHPGGAWPSPSLPVPPGGAPIWLGVPVDPPATTPGTRVIRTYRIRNLRAPAAAFQPVQPGTGPIFINVPPTLLPQVSPAPPFGFDRVGAPPGAPWAPGDSPPGPGPFVPGPFAPFGPPSPPDVPHPSEPDTPESIMDEVEGGLVPC